MIQKQNLSLLLFPLLLLALVTTTLPSVVLADDADDDSTESEDTEETETEETETEETGDEDEDEDTDTEDDTEAETEAEDETDDTETEETGDNTVEDDSQNVQAAESESVSVAVAAAPADNPGNGNTQPGRVGSHDNAQQTSGEGANAGGTVTDPTITGDPTVVDPGDTVTANCFGKVIQHEAQEHKTDPDEGTLGSHASDPVPEIPGNETPRQGIGNQNQGHPAAHGAFNSQFEEEDAENVAENC